MFFSSSTRQPFNKPIVNSVQYVTDFVSNVLIAYAPLQLVGRAGITDSDFLALNVAWFYILVLLLLVPFHEKGEGAYIFVISFFLLLITTS